MQKKLTLTIDQLVVEQAKRYAKQRHRSVSRKVEDYLRKISIDESEETEFTADVSNKSSYGKTSVIDKAFIYSDIFSRFRINIYQKER